jgi:hypothetical protein
MKKTLTLSLLLLTLSLPATVLAQSATPAQPVQPAQATQPTPVAPQTTPAQTTIQPSSWTHADLQAATYVVLAPSLEGTPGTLSADQQKIVLVAMKHDLQGAVLRKYPTARFVTDASTPGVITLRPVVTVPGSLWPWNNFQARVEMGQNGGKAVVQDNFGVLEVYNHQADAVNYLFDRLVGKLP